MHGHLRFRILGALVAGTLIAGIGVGVSSGLVTTSSHPHPNPTIAVNPHTALVDLQKVEVIGSHFSRNAEVATVECSSSAVDENGCDLSTLVYANADGRGALTERRYVRRIIDVGGGTIDCALARKSCAIGAADISDLTQAASTPISFDPRVPPVPTTLTADPSTKLRDHQLVKVTGQGFSPGSEVQVIECVNNLDFQCAYETARFGQVDNSGKLVIPNFALEREFIAFGNTGQGGTVDCAQSPRTCVLEAQTNGLGGTANARLAFDPHVPPAVPAITVAPSTNLADLQLVSVDGFGFLPGSQVTVQECTTSTFACDPGSVTVTAGFQGQFKLTVPVRRRIASQGVNGVVNTDCAAHLGECDILAFGQGATVTPTVSLSFNKNKPPVKTSMTVKPHTDLVDNQRVAVTLDGFAPFRQIAVVECSAAALSEQNLGYCDPSSEVITTSPAGGGSPSLAYFVRRQIAGQNGLVNCASKPGACVLVALPFQFFGYIGPIGGIPGSDATPAGASTFGRTAAAAGGLPAPATGRAVHAASGSSIPGIAVTALSFR